VIAATCTLAACGGSSEQERAAEELKKSSEEMQKGADSMSKGAEDMARGFEAMAKGLAGAAGSADIKPVDPVSFRELQTVMPDVAGWEKANPTGERMSSPFSFSIEQKIMDSGFNQLLFTPFTMFMAAGYEKETQDGFERSVNVAGYPGWEKWDKDSKNGELNVVVNKRFLVQLEGHGVDDIQTLHTVLERTDLKKLAALN
jgi:hypothetical protein